MRLLPAPGLALFFVLCSGSNSFAVTPTFTTGTVTSHTESTQTVTESILQTDYQTGFTYTVSGSNITIPNNPTHGSTYTQTTPGEAFQFSETYFGPGISRVTAIDRTTTTTSVTDSLSVFTQ
mgnify:CR=1 FL=1